jgi:hypothetical protein
MWPWILGAAAGLAGLAYAARSSNKHESRAPTRTRQLASARPSLAPGHGSYWDAFGLASDEHAKARATHTEALARIIASEAGTMSRAIKLTVAWIARNRSLLIKRPMLDMAAPQGSYGPITEKRPMSSSQPATDETRAIAAEVLAAPQSQDPTPGATHGFDTALQDTLAAQGIKSNSAAGVMEIWEKHYGLKKVATLETWVLYR